MSPFLSLVPSHLHKKYRVLRVLLWFSIVSVVTLFALRVLFPTLQQSFDFRTPGSSRNAIMNPRSPELAPRTNGKIESGGTLIADTAVIGDFSLLQVAVVLEKKSALPASLLFSLRRSYQSFFYPTGEAVTAFPAESNYAINGQYYALRNGTLYPYVSEAAFLSRFPHDQAQIEDSSFLNEHPISDTWLGFRVGTLLSNATGVFIVTNETEVRPVGSAEIFLALGYNFSDVIPASEEELGVYKRGRIVLLGFAHPDGTVLYDQENNTHYLIDQGTKRPLLGVYRDFLREKTHPILVSTRASERSISCTLLPNFFGTNLTCAAPLVSLTPGFGNDFQLQLNSPETTIDINNLTLSFETAKNKQNFLSLLSQIKQRLLARLGGV